jgi:hypothetical protein
LDVKVIKIDQLLNWCLKNDVENCMLTADLDLVGDLWVEVRA